MPYHSMIRQESGRHEFYETRADHI